MPSVFVERALAWKADMKKWLRMNAYLGASAKPSLYVTEIQQRMSMVDKAAYFATLFTTLPLM